MLILQFVVEKACHILKQEVLWLIVLHIAEHVTWHG
jgi:hypothetical protein